MPSLTPPQISIAHAYKRVPSLTLLYGFVLVVSLSLAGIVRADDEVLVETPVSEVHSESAPETQSEPLSEPRDANSSVELLDDTTPPVFTVSILAPIRTATSATITWGTDEPATSVVQYGTSSANYNFSSTSPGLTTSHTVVLTNLSTSTLYFTRVTSADASGNVASSTGSFNSGDDPGQPIISNSVATPINTSATITWDTNIPADSSVEYGFLIDQFLRPVFNLSSSSLVLETSHSIVLTGLATSTQYHYRIKSTGTAGITRTFPSAGERSFTTTNEADVTPPVITVPTPAPGINIGSTTALLFSSTNENTTRRIEYGATTQYGFATSSSLYSTGGSLLLINLLPGTLYHYRVIRSDASGNTATSSDYMFTTIVSDSIPPTISLVSASALATTSTISFTTNEITSGNFVEYGTTTAYGLRSSISGNFATLHARQLISLAPSTLYHYRVKAFDYDGNESTSGDFTFTTQEFPKLTNISAAPTNSGATITWNTDYPASSQVQYGADSSYTDLTTVDLTLTTNHSVQLSGLRSNSTYHYSVISTESGGSTTTSTDQTFTTGSSGGGGGGGGSRSRSRSGGGSSGSSKKNTDSKKTTAKPVVKTTTSPTVGTTIVTPIRTVFTRDLTVGSNDPDVRSLQQILVTRGFLNPAYVTGYFGPLTQAALANYQRSVGIAPALGYFGTITRGSLNGTTAQPSVVPATPVTATTVPAPTAAVIVPTVTVPSAPLAPIPIPVKATLPAPATPVSTQATMPAAPALKPVVTPPAPKAASPILPISTSAKTTKTSLTRTLILGSSVPDVTVLQQFLSQYPAWYPSGTVSGYYGPQTQAAVIAFQASFGIAYVPSDPEYGRVGALTREKINSMMGGI